MPVAAVARQAWASRTTSVNRREHAITHIDGCQRNYNAARPSESRSQQRLRLKSQVTNTVTIMALAAGYRPAQIEHDIQLREGEVNILGGLFETDSKTVNGWPWP